MKIRTKIAIVSALLIISPVIISQIIRIPLGKWTIGDENAWVGFFGSYLGSIISGAITYFVFWETIKYYRKKDKLDNDKQEEIKKLSIRPYLIVKNLDRDKQSKFEIWSNYTKIRFVSGNGNLVIRNVAFEIENVGLGTALDINFTKLLSYKNKQSDDLVAKVGDKLGIDFHIRIPPEGFTGTCFCTVTYSDLLGNKYYQYIKLVMNINDICVLNTSVPDLINDTSS